MSVTSGFPFVNVPVLSNTMVSTFDNLSITSPPFTRTPFLAPFPIPATFDTGAPITKAPGQATIYANIIGKPGGRALSIHYPKLTITFLLRKFNRNRVITNLQDIYYLTACHIVPPVSYSKPLNSNLHCKNNPLLLTHILYSGIVLPTN